MFSFFKEVGFLPRKLKRCPRKATARSRNHIAVTLKSIDIVSYIRFLKQTLLFEWTTYGEIRFVIRTV
ncbi:hypothetical protein GH741_17380 [Aquibacillus halophilus]|uniref:Uncharacterized protein n=1 Tax=Aquibacillus halophilus TaxID=930132 RepID=A0A6A8DKZ4_9BACI|nr:hypothetical protein [Aquibacillus halophilus]MRH44419.1 hypothetical protein [Aquibacillus halophilus]